MTSAKKLILFIFLCFTGAAVKAQNGMYAGLRADFHSSALFFQNTSEVFRDYPEKEGTGLAYELTFGFGAHVDVGFSVSNYWSLNIGLGYSKLGQKMADQYVISSGPLAVTHELSFGYLNLPILLRYSNYEYGDKAAFFLAFGPRVGFMVSASEKLTINGVPDTEIGDPFLKYSSVEVGFELSPGADIYFNHRSFLSINLNAYIGLINLNTDYFEPFIPDGQDGLKSMRNLYFGIQFGYHWMVEQRYRGRGRWR